MLKTTWRKINAYWKHVLRSDVGHRFVFKHDNESEHMLLLVKNCPQNTKVNIIDWLHKALI